MTEALVALLLAVPAAAAAALLAVPERALEPLNRAAALAVAVLAAALAARALGDVERPLRGAWFVVDPAGATFLAVVAGVGLLGALSSRAYLAHGRAGTPAPRAYYAAYHAFWAALLAVVLADNLALAWLLIEATTAASALLVASSRRSSALEAGWKYLLLTSLGLVVALLGIVALYAGLRGRLHALDWRAIHAAAPTLPRHTALFATALLLVGLAAKIGWAPVHNWLPDAHS